MAGLSARDKVRSLVESGLADNAFDAIVQLIDMGEISQSQADRLMDRMAKAERGRTRTLIEHADGSTTIQAADPNYRRAGEVT